MRRAGAALLAAVLVTAALAVADQENNVTPGPLPIDAFARLEKGMGEQQVLAAAGLPTSEGTYRPLLDRVLKVVGLGKAYRTYFYRGMGRVMFSGGSKLLQNGTVVRVDVDPKESGAER
jgi:hypothetical protein